ncbi:MAG: hypothetical protein AAF196_04135 [Planctomycetota bacterium]
MIPSVSRSLLLLGFLGLSVVATSCRTIPPDQTTDALTINRSAFAGQPIVDVVVLPIEDRSPRLTFADNEAVLRESLARKLVDLEYSAIRDLTYVDRAMAAAGVTGGSSVNQDLHAGLRNRMEEDAILGIRVDSWELGRLDENPPFVSFSAQVLMTASETGEVLVSGQFGGLIHPSEGIPPTTRKGRAEAAADRLGAILLNRVPFRAAIADVDG